MSGGDQPLVSVLMPYYNGSGFMYEAIESVLNQTYKNIEIIVIDDALPRKKESEYIEDLSAKLGFKLIKHSFNRGICLSLVDGFKAADGEFIAELSQDDLYRPEKIEQQLRELLEKDLDAVYAAGDILYCDSGKTAKRRTLKTRNIIDSGNAAERLKLQNLNCLSIQGLLAKRSVFKEDIVPIWREFMLDDWPVNIRLFEKYRVGFLEGPLWTSKVHSANTSFDIWRWFGPQIEVVARMAPEHLKAEGIGNRLASMARRVHKQNGNKEDIIRLAFAGLMLTDSLEQHKKASRVLEKMHSKDKKAITNSKRKRFEEVSSFVQEKVLPERTTNTNWENLGKEIANVISTYRGNKRLNEIGKHFSSLAYSVLSGEQSVDCAVKIALAALMLVDTVQDEMQIVETLRSVPAGYKEELIKEKYQILKVQSRFSIRARNKTTRNVNINTENKGFLVVLI